MAAGEQYTITFTLEGSETVAVPACAGESLLDAAKRAGVALDAPCGGSGTCGKCRVRLLAGSVSGGQSRHLSPEEYSAGWRLACVSRPDSDVSVLVPQTARAYQNRIQIHGPGEIRETDIFANLLHELTALGMGPRSGAGSGLEPLRVELSAPAAGGESDAFGGGADRERLLRKIAQQTGLAETAVNISLYALRRLPAALRCAVRPFAVDCVIRREQAGLTVLDVFGAADGGPAPVIAGLAIDIGTTTVQALLVHIAGGEILASGSAGNAQIRYGADVISRIIESGRPGGLERLRYAICDECLAPLIRSLCETAAMPPEQIYRVAIAANTTMTHLFLGVNPEFLRLEPYTPAFFESCALRCALRCAELGLPAHPDAAVLTAPAIGSYVGGDISAGVFSSMIFKKQEISLLIDLGTNGELVLGNAEFLMSCACSAGPAFEGGDISCGMRATDGAIEACVIDEATLEPRLTVIGGNNQRPLGFCGSGLIDIIGELFRCRIINAKGKYIAEGGRIRRDEWGGAAYIAAFGDDGGGENRGVALTESDIDNFIRAKAAIFSAIRTMLAALDCGVDAIENVYVAGGIGSGINIGQAIRIGMLPNLPPEKYHYIGNSSLHGAYSMLVSEKAAAKIGEISRGMTYIELSAHPGYMDELVAACFLPHTNGALFE